MSSYRSLKRNNNRKLPRNPLPTRAAKLGESAHRWNKNARWIEERWRHGWLALRGGGGGVVVAIVRGWTTVTSNRWRQTRVTTSRISLGLQLKRCQSLNSSPRVCGCIWWGWRGIKGSVERWANFGRHPWLFHPLVLRASRRTLVTTALPDGERGIERTQGDEPRPLGHVHNGGAYVVSVSRRLRTCRCVLGRFKIPKIYRMP